MHRLAVLWPRLALWHRVRQAPQASLPASTMSSAVSKQHKTCRSDVHPVNSKKATISKLKTNTSDQASCSRQAASQQQTGASHSTSNSSSCSNSSSSSTQQTANKAMEAAEACSATVRNFYGRCTTPCRHICAAPDPRLQRLL